MKTGSYFRHAAELERRLARALPPRELEALHRLDGRRHALVALRHAALFVACALVGLATDDPWIWVPVAALQGANVLGFMILLHEVIHGLVAPGLSQAASRRLAILYALPSAISPSQFERWHLDHHRELGSDVDDPKRAHLSPKRNSRLLKLLYFTPALFLIYFRAAARESRGYELELRRRIRRERLIGIGAHAVVVAALALVDPHAILRVWAAPLLVFFPIAFALNRLGQHYDVDPRRVAAWSTRVDGNAVVRFVFLASNHHVEHHWYPGVPLYRLARLNRALRPFFAAEGIPDRGYLVLLWGWLVSNRAPHTDWHVETRSEAAPALQNQ